MALWNLKHFLADEGYTSLESAKVVSYCEERGMELLRRSVFRLRLNASDCDTHLIPRVFDSWLHYVRIRRHAKRYLGKIINQL